MLPCLVFEDEHLLVVNKPAGLNTHAPDPYLGEGIYDWLRHREPRWASLAIIHRLDKETSGLIVFSKSTLANRSLTGQFTARTVRKKYLLLTDRAVPKQQVTVRSSLVRAGERYVPSTRAGAEPAQTRFRVRKSPAPQARGPDLPVSPRDLSCLEAEPLTGRTHQIRVHAAEKGFPIFGDVLYGGTAASRLFLHAAEITFRHPASGEAVSFRADPDWGADARMALRTALIEPELTDAFRIIHGASDGWPGWHIDKLGQYLLSQSERPLTEIQRNELQRLSAGLGAAGVFHKRWHRQLRQTTPAEVSPQLVLGEAPDREFVARENGLRFQLSFSEGYSVGLFLDQRDNRRRLQKRHVAAGFPLFNFSGSGAPEVLNAFAYTCGFSVCAAKAGARTTSLDLSRKYLEWGRRNFLLNGVDPAAHDFIYGDAFAWFRRLQKKGRLFDLVLLDPPTFSQSRESGAFRAEKDYSRLVAAALPLIRRPGVLFASSNAAGGPPGEFVAAVQAAIASSGRKVLGERYFPQPPDFVISRREPAYLKTLWLQLD